MFISLCDNLVTYMNAYIQILSTLLLLKQILDIFIHIDLHMYIQLTTGQQTKAFDTSILFGG